jgi:hypothetical protein
LNNTACWNIIKNNTSRNTHTVCADLYARRNEYLRRHPNAIVNPNGLRDQVEA